MSFPYNCYQFIDKNVQNVGFSYFLTFVIPRLYALGQNKLNDSRN